MLEFINDYDKDKASSEFKSFMEAFQLKHNMVQDKLRVKFHSHPFRENQWSATFYDGRFPSEKDDNKVGSVNWVQGSRTPYEFLVESRLIQNAKFSGWSAEYHSQRTKDTAKAIKIALNNLKPFGWNELTNEARENAQQSHKKWAGSNSQVAYDLRIDPDTMAEELNNLIEQGVVFKTSQFKNAIGALPAYMEYLERRKKPANMDTVMLHEGVVVFMKHGDSMNPTMCKSIEELPEGHQTKIALLRLLGDNEYLPEVGYKKSEYKYVVYE